MTFLQPTKVSLPRDEKDKKAKTPTLNTQADRFAT